MKYGALRAQGIEVVERVAAPTRSCRAQRRDASQDARSLNVAGGRAISVTDKTDQDVDEHVHRADDPA
jgi:hypothetical protein